MAKITRFTLKPFGSTGPIGDFGQFGSLAAGSIVYSKDPAVIQALGAWDTGWASETIANNRPALEDFNSLDFVMGQAVCYLYQQGIPEWDSATTYYANSFCQVAGVVYKSLNDTNLNNNPTSSPTWWELYDSSPVGSAIQVVNYSTGDLLIGSGVMMFDDTIPQNTEGTEYLSVTITPKSATSKLRIDVLLNWACTGGTNNNFAMALFQDSVANALNAVDTIRLSTQDNSMMQLTMTHFMTAGTTSPTTFKVRAGLNVANTTYINGYSGLRLFGGVLISSITVTEIKA